MELQSRKQRGIYSEVLAQPDKEDPNDPLQPESVASGPTARLQIHQAQRLPRARGLQRKKPNDLELSVSADSSGIYSKKREGVADIDPKVFEPYMPIPGRTPRKVVIDRKKKLFASLRIEDLLKNEGVDYSRPIAAWLPLEPFDDREYDVRNSDEWIELATISGTFEAVPGLGLQKDHREPGAFNWKPVLIHSYDAEREVFYGS